MWVDRYKDQFTIVPVLVGSLSPDREAAYGRIFARYLAEPQNLFIISSDFCHWGQRFRYTYYDRNWGQIYQSITRLDRMVSIQRLSQVKIYLFILLYNLLFSSNNIFDVCKIRTFIERLKFYNLGGLQQVVVAGFCSSTTGTTVYQDQSVLLFLIKYKI